MAVKRAGFMGSVCEIPVSPEAIPDQRTGMTGPASCPPSPLVGLGRGRLPADDPCIAKRPAHHDAVASSGDGAAREVLLLDHHGQILTQSDDVLGPLSAVDDVLHRAAVRLDAGALSRAEPHLLRPDGELDD